MRLLNWKEYKGIKYADSKQGFFWLVYPSGINGQMLEVNEDEVKKAIDSLKVFK